MLILEDKKQEEFVKIILGVPEKFRVGEIQKINYEVVCVYSQMEFIKTPEDTLTVLDENGNDVSSYQWWTVPGKYNLTVTTYAICPLLTADKAPTSLSAHASPVSNQSPQSLETKDFDALVAALQVPGASPLLLQSKNQTFDGRSKPFNASIINLGLSSAHAPSSIEFDPELFAASQPTGLTSQWLTDTTSQPTSLTASEDLSVNSLYAPSNLEAWTSTSVEPRNAAVHNLSFVDNPEATPTNASISNIVLREENKPTFLNTLVSPAQISGLGTLVDMDEDGVYADVDYDDNDPNIGSSLVARHSPTSIQVLASPAALTSFQAITNPAALTNLAYLVDMDEDGVYADVDFDDNDPSIGAVVPPTSSDAPVNITATAPPQVANKAPSNLSVADVDMDEDGVYASADYDDNNASIQTAPKWGLAVSRVAYTAPMYPDMSIDGGANWIIGNPNLLSLVETTYGSPILVRANQETYTSLASFSSGRPTWYFQGYSTTTGTAPGEISFDPYDPNLSVNYNIGVDNGYATLVVDFQTHKTPIFIYYTEVAVQNKISSADTATLKTAEGTVQILPYIHPGHIASHSTSPPIYESTQTPAVTGYTGQNSWVTLTAPTTITDINGNTRTFDSFYNASLSSTWVGSETVTGNSVKFISTIASMSAPIVYYARYN